MNLCGRGKGGILSEGSISGSESLLVIPAFLDEFVMDAFENHSAEEGEFIV
jgi:hypothetical protein